MDSVSRIYGIGYDLCGDLEYSLSGTNNYTDAFMVFAPTVNTALVDDLRFDVKSDASLGNYVVYSMTLTAKLKNYPSSTPASIPVVFNYRECRPTDFSFNLASVLPGDGSTVEIFTGNTHADI